MYTSEVSLKASRAKQSLFEIVKSVLNTVLRLLQDSVLRHDIRGNFTFKLHFSELSQESIDTSSPPLKWRHLVNTN